MHEYTDPTTILKFLKNNHTRESLDTSFLNQLDACIFIFDMEHMKPLWINSFFYRIFKYSAEDLRTMTAEQFLDMFHPKSRKHFLQRMSNYEDREGYRSIYELKTKDGQWVYLLLSSRVFQRNTEGSVKLLLGYATEVERNELAKHQKKIKDLDGKSENFSDLEKLSKREKDIIELITRGLTDKEIALNLGISINTTKTHRKRIISKLGLKNTAALVKFAVDNDLV
jgi:PAS domain S-box-containing protein